MPLSGVVEKGVVLLREGLPDGLVLGIESHVGGLEKGLGGEEGGEEAAPLLHESKAKGQEELLLKTGLK